MHDHHLPAPGSPEAVDLGCTCPVEQNLHGVVPPISQDHWWLREDCPLHRQWLRGQALRGHDIAHEPGE